MKWAKNPDKHFPWQAMRFNETILAVTWGLQPSMILTFMLPSSLWHLQSLCSNSSPLYIAVSDCLIQLDSLTWKRPTAATCTSALCPRQGNEPRLSSLLCRGALGTLEAASMTRWPVSRAISCLAISCHFLPFATKFQKLSFDFWRLMSFVIIQLTTLRRIRVE